MYESLSYHSKFVWNAPLALTVSKKVNSDWANGLQPEARTSAPVHVLSFYLMAHASSHTADGNVTAAVQMHMLKLSVPGSITLKHRFTSGGMEPLPVFIKIKAGHEFSKRFQLYFRFNVQRWWGFTNDWHDRDSMTVGGAHGVAS